MSSRRESPVLRARRTDSEDSPRYKRCKFIVEFAQCLAQCRTASETNAFADTRIVGVQAAERASLSNAIMPPNNFALQNNDSVPVIAPAAAALVTACSISRCELMPADFRNLRMLRFSASSFIGISRFSG